MVSCQVFQGSDSASSFQSHDYRLVAHGSRIFLLPKSAKLNEIQCLTFDCNNRSERDSNLSLIVRKRRQPAAHNLIELHHRGLCNRHRVQLHHLTKIPIVLICFRQRPNPKGHLA